MLPYNKTDALASPADGAASAMEGSILAPLVAGTTSASEGSVLA